MSDITKAASDVLAERARQQSAEGWTVEHDDTHSFGELAAAAACYACPELAAVNWPWERAWWKPKGARPDLVRAGALILAEIERIDRLAARGCVSAAPTGCVSDSECAAAGYCLERRGGA